jgi:hypothetical protein
VRALYYKPPTASDLAEWGLRPEDVPPPDAQELWAENWPAIEFFRDVATQWRQGAGGPTGLDYAVVFHELDRKGYAGDAYDEMMSALRVIESAALNEIHKR